MPAEADWEKWRTRQVAQRLTDRFLTDDSRIKTRPLPASFQLLGATAAMWVLVEAQPVSLGVQIEWPARNTRGKCIAGVKAGPKAIALCSRVTPPHATAAIVPETPPQPAGVALTTRVTTR